MKGNYLAFSQMIHYFILYFLSTNTVVILHYLKFAEVDLARSYCSCMRLWTKQFSKCMLIIARYFLKWFAENQITWNVIGKSLYAVLDKTLKYLWKSKRHRKCRFKLSLFLILAYVRITNRLYLKNSEQDSKEIKISKLKSYGIFSWSERWYII